MNNLHKFALSLPLLAALSGCVIAFGDLDGHGMNPGKVEKQNLQAIEMLSLGAAYGDSREKLGTPDFTEAFAGQGGEYKVLFYRTQHVTSDDKTTRDETTPVVFRDGKLIGYGQKVYDAIKL